jgi:lysozyme
MDTLHFVICKATEGKTYIDPDFAANWKFIRAKGLVRGAYHFYHSNDDPIMQAQHFLSAIKNIDSADIPPVIDIEEGGLEGVVDLVELENNLFLFLHYIEQKIKRKPVIYTDLSFADTYLTSSSFGEYPLWLAEYSGKDSPRMPKAWKGKKYAIWQKKDSYKIDSRNTDFDVFNGSGIELVDFIRRY